MAIQNNAKKERKKAIQNNAKKERKKGILNVPLPWSVAQLLFFSRKTS